jgi:hypothetical protein
LEGERVVEAEDGGVDFWQGVSQGGGGEDEGGEGVVEDEASALRG